MVLIIIVDQVINKTGMVDTSEEGFQRVLDNTDVIVIFICPTGHSDHEKNEKDLQTATQLSSFFHFVLTN